MERPTGERKHIKQECEELPMGSLECEAILSEGSEESTDGEGDKSLQPTERGFFFVDQSGPAWKAECSSSNASADEDPLTLDPESLEPVAPSEDRALAVSETSPTAAFFPRPSKPTGQLEKLFQCNACGKTYAHRGNLANHLATHLRAAQRFGCTECDKSFKQGGSLKAHMVTHTGERKFLCHVCEKRFTQASNLRTHMVTHSGQRKFRCVECGKAFVHANGLKLHGAVHAGRRPFECRHCGKTFSQSNGLKTHALIHAGKRFLCTRCEQAFMHRSSLKRHMARHDAKEAPGTTS